VLTKVILGVKYRKELYRSASLRLPHLAYYSLKLSDPLELLKEAFDPPKEALDPLDPLGEGSEETRKPLKEALKYRLPIAILCLNTALNARQLYSLDFYPLLNGIWSRISTPTWHQLQ
jgi:hypothetical protein